MNFKSCKIQKNGNPLGGVPVFHPPEFADVNSQRVFSSENELSFAGVLTEVKQGGRELTCAGLRAVFFGGSRIGRQAFDSILCLLTFRVPGTRRREFGECFSKILM